MDYECFCGETYGERDMLVQHNVNKHGMQEEESRQRVLEKYPVGGP